MRKHKIIYFFYILIIFILCTCNDPVFYAISQEVKPIAPRISGVPTNFVIYNGRMYVASGINLYSYNKGTDEEPDKPYWNMETSPGGNILQIASCGGNLYALCATDQNNDGKTVIKRLEQDNLTWTQMGDIFDDYPKIHNIFAAGDVLFVSATAKQSDLDFFYFTILYIINDKIEVLNTDNPEDTGELNGAVYNENYNLYYLTAKNRGVYRIDNIDEGAKLINYQNAEGKNVNVNFTGIINLEDAGNTILLISRNGDVYTVNDSIKKENVSMGKMSTGALAIYMKPPEPEDDPAKPKRLLLAGRQDSLTYSATYAYSYGYMELELDDIGIKSGSNFIEPGRNPAFSTLLDYERYQSTIGKYPVNYLFQVPSDIDGNMILFASTQKSGVWSCRDRDSNASKYWNAEGENEP